MSEEQRDKLLDLFKLLGVFIVLAVLGILGYIAVSRNTGEQIHWEGVVIICVILGIALVMIAPDKFSEVIKALTKRFSKGD